MCQAPSRHCLDFPEFLLNAAVAEQPPPARTPGAIRPAPPLQTPRGRHRPTGHASVAGGSCRSRGRRGRLSGRPGHDVVWGGEVELTVVPRSESPSTLHLWWQRRLASERGLETSETSRPPRNLSWHQALSRQPAQPLFGSAELTVIRRSKSPSEVPDWSYLLWQRRLASRPPGSSVACFNPRVGLLDVEWEHV